MSIYLLPALYTAALWWAATGVILFLNRLPRRSFPLSLLCASLLLPIAGIGLQDSSTDTSAAGAYVSFACVILIWGWVEMTFLMGFITGPRTHACAQHCSGARHFMHALQAIFYHEIALIAAVLAVATLTDGAPNQFGLWTIVLLWVMRQSAKLNLFFGVPNLGEQFLPVHMQYLKSFFRRRAMNLFFPLSVTGATVMAVELVRRALAPAASELDVAGYSILAALMSLALLEHWFLVVPLPSENLWRWSLRAPRADARVSALVPAAAPRRAGERA